MKWEKGVKSELPLTFTKVKFGINSLVLKLRKAVISRNGTADNTVDSWSVLNHHVSIRRLEGEIISVIRRYNLMCPHCKNRSILGGWYLVDSETQLKCPLPECNKYTVLEQHQDFLAIEALLNLAPVQWSSDILHRESECCFDETRRFRMNSAVVFYKQNGSIKIGIS